MATAEETPAVTAGENSVEVKATDNVDTAKPVETKERATDANGSAAKGPTGADEDDFERYEDDHKKRDHNDNRGNRNRDKGDRRGNKRGDGRRDGKFNGSSRGGHRGDKRNVKTRFDRRPESSDADLIRRQVEFYFSDSNLPIDNFLLGEVQGVKNKPVPLKVIHSFSRMRNFQPFSAVVEAVKQSDLLDVNENDEVSRKQPIDGSFTLDVKENGKLLTSDSMKRSIYVKGFGPEGEETAFEIEEFFEPYGIKGVRLRRDDTRTFKGSVFVEFADEASANNFLELDPKPKFKGEELLVKSKKAYVDEKNEAIRDGTVQPRSPNRDFGGNARKNRQGGGGGGRRGQYRDRKRRRDDDDGGDGDGDDKDDWRARRDRFQGKRRKDESADSAKGGEDGEKSEEKAEEKSKAGTEKPETATAA